VCEQDGGVVCKQKYFSVQPKLNSSHYEINKKIFERIPLDDYIGI